MPVVTHEEVANILREHYARISSDAGSCFPTIAKAIDAWEREPKLLERIKELERELDAQRNAARQMLKDARATIHLEREIAHLEREIADLKIPDVQMIDSPISEKFNPTSFIPITKSWKCNDNDWWNKTIAEGARIPWWARIWKYDPLHHQMHILPIPLCWLARLGWNAWCASLLCWPNRLEQMLEKARQRGYKEGLAEKSEE